MLTRRLTSAELAAGSEMVIIFIQNSTYFVYQRHICIDSRIGRRLPNPAKIGMVGQTARLSLEISVPAISRDCQNEGIDLGHQRPNPCSREETRETGSYPIAKRSKHEGFETSTIVF